MYSFIRFSSFSIIMATFFLSVTLDHISVSTISLQRHPFAAVWCSIVLLASNFKDVFEGRIIGLEFPDTTLIFLFLLTINCVFLHIGSTLHRGFVPPLCLTFLPSLLLCCLLHPNSWACVSSAFRKRHHVTWQTGRLTLSCTSLDSHCSTQLIQLACLAVETSAFFNYQNDVF